MTDLSFYTDLQASVEDILAELGQVLTYRSFTKKTYDPATGKTVRENSDSLCKIAIFPISQEHIVEPKTRFGDREAYLSPYNLSIEPKEDDEVISWAAGSAWTIENSSNLSFSAALSRITDESGQKRFASAKIGENITASGSANNNRTFTIQAVAADGSYIQVYPAPVDEAAGKPISLAATALSKQWKVVAAEPMQPAGVTVYHLLYLREVQP